MTNLTDKFDALEAQLATQASTMGAYVDTVEAKLQAINDFLDVMNENGAANTQYLLKAIGQIDICQSCPPSSIITPVTDPTLTPINSDRCKRAQALIHALSRISEVFGAATDSGIFWSPSIVISGINEVVSTLISGGSVPLPSFGEGVNIAGDAINYGLSNIGRGHNLKTQFDSISSDMRDAIYFSGTASAAQSAYLGIVDSSSLPNDEKLLFKALGFNALFSYFLDPDSTPDLSGYSGTACAGDLTDITTCTQFSSTCALGTDGHTRAHLIVPPAYSAPLYTAGDYYGWTFKYISGVSGIGMNIYRYTPTGTPDVFVTSISIGNQWTILDHTAAIQVVAPAEPDDSCHPFVVEICPPA